MREYLDLMRRVRETGARKEDRTGTGTLSVFGYQMRFDLSEGFPVVTTKKLHLRSIIHELLWFLKGDTNIAWLKENGMSIVAGVVIGLGGIFGWQFWDSYQANKAAEGAEAYDRFVQVAQGVVERGQRTADVAPLGEGDVHGPDSIVGKLAEEVRSPGGINVEVLQPRLHLHPRPGDLLPLEKRINKDLILKVAGRNKFAGQPGQHRGQARRQADARLQAAVLQQANDGRSGGEDGARYGPSIMPGGDPVAWPEVQ